LQCVRTLTRPPALMGPAQTSTQTTCEHIPASIEGLGHMHTNNADNLETITVWDGQVHPVLMGLNLRSKEPRIATA
jgi:hypothetical protein